MNKVMLICGTICSGKSTYAQRITRTQKAVVLSCDEISLSLFEGDLGAKHDETITKIKDYLFKKSIEIYAAGSSAVLDFGFWSRDERIKTTEFFRKNDISPEWHYIDISKSAHKKNIESRNEDVKNGACVSYYIDDNLLAKATSSFEPPTPDEIDVLFKDNRG